MERSIVLIDAENILKSWQNFCKENNLQDKIDYEKLVTVLSEGTNLLRAYFYDGIRDPPHSRKKKFLESLQAKGIQLRTKILRNRYYICKNCSTTETRQVQKGVDVSLATDILRHAWQETCEICIVVSGDEDYTDAIEVAKDKGLRVWVASFTQNLSKDLRNCADKVIFIEDIFDKITFVQNNDDKTKI